MATRFGVWIDSPNTGEFGNMMSYSSFASDTQRSSGFMAGTIASSIRVNTALRQATLVTAALMNVIAPDSTMDMNSSLSTVTTNISTFFASYAKHDTITTSDEGRLASWTEDNGEMQLKAGAKITISTSEPTAADGENGDIWFVIEA